MSNTPVQYSAADMDTLEGLEPVRAVPAMYTHIDHPLHVTQEIIDNSVDEALAGFATKIDVTIFKDGFIQVKDNGRGIPVDINPKNGLSGPHIVFLTLHGGGKFHKTDSTSQYRFSGGLHGVGASVTNALSLRMDVHIRREGGLHHIAFENGKEVSPLVRLKNVAKSDTGTCIKFKPDPQFFQEPMFNVNALEKVLRAKAVLLPAVTLTLSVEKEDGEFSTLEWHYPEGLQSYLEESSLELNAVAPLFFTSVYLEQDTGEFLKDEGVDFGIFWSETPSGSGESFVNLIPTANGGTHVNGLKLALYEVVKEYAEANSLVPKGTRLSADDIWKNIRYVLALRKVKVSFAGQVKEKLESREAYTLVSSLAKPKLWQWFLENSEEAKIICSIAIDNAQKRNNENQVIERKKMVGGSVILPGKLYDCETKNPKEAEVFLVEGDSAGGSLGQARKKRFQAYLALKGKIKNTWEVTHLKIKESQEVKDILDSLNVPAHEMGDTEALKGLRYDKVIIATDADDDGFHIQVLLKALFLKHLPELIRQGKLYIALPPLFRIVSYSAKKGNRTVYVKDIEEKDVMVKQLLKEGFKEADIHITRFKGLGEMNPSQLWDTVVNPDTRRLIRLTLPEDFEDLKDTDKLMDYLLKKQESGWRRAWMTKKGNLVNDD